jgi:hypothetical protein
LSGRRGFLRKGIGVLLGTALSFLALPELEKGGSVDVSAIGDNQLLLLQASRAFAEKAGMLRAMAITHYLPDTGEVEMILSLSIPPETSISQQINNLAQQVLTLVKP